jgi:transcriptional regulator with XRE-family HTH domain
LFHKLQNLNFAIMDIRNKIGIRLRELRNEKGLSQEKFSFACELDRTYIASIEQGRRNVSIANIEKIAKALNITIYDFFNTNSFQ